MHLANDAITPACALITAGAASIGLALAIVGLRRSAPERTALTTAALLGAAVFAAQAVNVPVLPFCSAHVVGGALLALAVGPALGVVAMTLVLLAQALLLGDGGVMALGANVVNMALIPAGLVALLRRHQLGSLGHGAIAGVAVLLAALLIIIETVPGRAVDAGFAAFAGQMLWTHGLIAVGEGLITASVLALIAKPGASPQIPSNRGIIATLLTIAGLIALVPIASTLPDGYEAALHAGGIGGIGGLSATIASWQVGLVNALALPDVLAITIGAALVGGVIVLLRPGQPAPITSR